MKWDHAGIKVADLDRSLRFYCDVLGFEIQEDLDIFGRRFVFVGNENTSLEIEQGNPGDTQMDPRFQTGQNHLAFLVDDVRGLVKRLESEGVSIVLEPLSTRPDRIVSFIEDPDGIFLQLIELIEQEPS